MLSNKRYAAMILWILGRRMIKFRVMNAKIGTTNDLDKPGYLYEPKLDGYRALCFVNGDVTFMSRNNKDLTSTYPELAFRQNIKAQSAILDGEIVAYDQNGHPNFALLQQGKHASYVVFDILMKDGQSLTLKPLLERKKILDSTVVDGNGIEKIFYTTKGQELWNEVVKRQMEGVMAKKSDSSYYPGQRSNVWLKIKLLNTLDCIIIGYLPGKRAIASLALGLYNQAGELVYIGNVGTGFTEDMIEELSNKLKSITTKNVSIKNKELLPRNSVMVKPLYVAEVKYLEMTPYGILRASVFLRLRDDKRPEECTFTNQ